MTFDVLYVIVKFFGANKFEACFHIDVQILVHKKSF